MTIYEKEENLFKEWQEETKEKLVKDGVISEEEYNKEENSPKILFILKEANNPEGNIPDLRKFISEDVLKGERPQTWDNIIRWAFGIKKLFKKEKIKWEDIKKVSEKMRQEVLSIAMMNLKKIPGGSTADDDKIAIFIRENAKYIKRQFELYNDADIIICATSEKLCDSFFENILQPTLKTNWQLTARGIYYLQLSEKRYLICFVHPEARVPVNILYYALLDAIKEIYYI